jgi:hypothetical protein
VRKAIEESNGLRLKIDKLQAQQSKSMVEDKEMSKKIEILEDELAEKENSVPHVVLLLPFELLLGNRSVPLVVLSFPFDQPVFSPDLSLYFPILLLFPPMSLVFFLLKFIMVFSLMASAKQHAKQIDSQTKAQMASAKEQNEKFDLLTDALMMLLKSQEKK